MLEYILPFSEIIPGDGPIGDAKNLVNFLVEKAFGNKFFFDVNQNAIIKSGFFGFVEKRVGQFPSEGTLEILRAYSDQARTYARYYQAESGEAVKVNPVDRLQNLPLVKYHIGMKTGS